MSKFMSPFFFYLTSYAWEVEYKPECVVELASLLLNHKEGSLVKKEPYHVDAVQNGLEKLGYMLFAKSRIAEINARREEFRVRGQRFGVQVIYHAWNFLNACKACLDAISGMLNQEYELGYKNGRIDLKHDFFFDEIQRKNEDLWQRMDKYREWIKGISKMRDHFIHRHGLFAAPLGSGSGKPDSTTRARLYLPGSTLFLR